MKSYGTIKMFALRLSNNIRADHTREGHEDAEIDHNAPFLAYAASSAMGLGDLRFQSTLLDRYPSKV
jgi:hypothetical protein